MRATAAVMYEVRESLSRRGRRASGSGLRTRCSAVGRNGVCHRDYHMINGDVPHRCT